VLSNRDALATALGELAASGSVDEVVLVPGTVDVRCAELAAEVVASLA
jgi:hypothetical protein